MKALTRRQQQTLDFIREFIELHKFPPTMREISEHFSISVKGAHGHVKALEKKNRLRCGFNKSRSIEILDDQAREQDKVARIPLLGSVAAGKPLFSEENFECYVKLPEDFLKKGTYFALRVQGDSMTGVGIRNGDTAVVLQQADAENGDIVVAMVDEAVTLKRFFREKNRIKLQAENPAYPPLYTQNIRVLGRLAHIFRAYE